MLRAGRCRRLPVRKTIEGRRLVRADGGNIYHICVRRLENARNGIDRSYHVLSGLS